MSKRIAIVGLACRFPEAQTPQELWENVLAKRRAFRRLPAERLNLQDYFSADRSAPDRIYATQAGVLENYTFDRVKFRVAGSSFRSADMTHWLALDVAAQALANAGFPEGKGLPHAATGVLVGNTLTGEFSRAALMRLRWPFVKRMVDASLADSGWSPGDRRDFLTQLEARYKAPFAPVGEETLAGGLSNTIAGRICNHFDLGGGGYTLDGACSSSLLAVANACAALESEDLDVALVGGVDLSLDPFELVGFAKTGALAPQEMRVFDANSAGFWPGEGCGFAVLMRYEDAVAECRHIYATINGWGISSDGSGGLTRPEVDGQVRALRRAYARAGYGIETVGYFEGHGTGTAVGDGVELKALTAARLAAGADQAAAVGSVKANIGHTKAAAGVAGLIKASMALREQVLPPNAGMETPHPVFSREVPVLRFLPQGEVWPANLPLRAGVSAMGFGGINVHVALEGHAVSRRQNLDEREIALVTSAQDTELFCIGAEDRAALLEQVEQLEAVAAWISRSELADLAAKLARAVQGKQVRAAVVADTPAKLGQRLGTLREWLLEGQVQRQDERLGVFLGAGSQPPRIAFLFPGQSAPTYRSGGALENRFRSLRTLYAGANLPAHGDGTETAIAQPAIVTASVAGLRVLESLGIHGTIAVGHSLGELTALHWAGAISEPDVVRLAQLRGEAMNRHCTAPGAMASIQADAASVQGLLAGHTPVTIACFNGPNQTVIAGEAASVEAAVARARARGSQAVSLRVSHAFHSPLMAGAVAPLAEALAATAFAELRRPVISTVTGQVLDGGADLRSLLTTQLTAPVRFTEALANVPADVDLLLEVGPGQILTGLVSGLRTTPAVAIDAGGPSLEGLLKAVGAAFALGAPVRLEALFAGRFTRPFTLERPSFLVNPCELAPLPDEAGQAPELAREPSAPAQSAAALAPAKPLLEGQPVSEAEVLELIRHLVAGKTEFPLEAVTPESRLLDDLHLNSISVGQLVAEAARQISLVPPAAPNDFANATIAEVAQALCDLARTGDTAASAPVAIQGIDTWVRPFAVTLVERPLGSRHVRSGQGSWQVMALPGCPLAKALSDRFAGAPGAGLVLCLPHNPHAEHIPLLLASARNVLAQGPDTTFVLVQQVGSAAGLARTLSQELPGSTVCVVSVPPNHPNAPEWVLAEALAATGHVEAHYDEAGTRREPVLSLLEGLSDEAAVPLTADDTLLVTGGGKGIAFECALALAAQTGVRLALFGRSRPEADGELRANLERLTQAGLKALYLSLDVTDTRSVMQAVQRAEQELGPVTAVLHGAGANVPQLLRTLDEAAFRQTVNTKVQGLENVLAAVDPDRLRLLVTFGSVIARTGMRGEAHYAVANEWLTGLTERWQAEHPACRCLAIEWSVWSGAGMGERLGRVEGLMREGITPIRTEEGIRILRQLLSTPLPAVATVVAGRLGNAVITQAKPALPMLRFLDKTLVHYPGIELVVEAELSPATDLYLDDHVYQGQRLVPAVMGLEAMAQTVMALTGTTVPPHFSDVAFVRPIIVPDGTPLTIRVAALRRESGEVQVVIRSAETGYAMDHFRATCHVTVPALAPKLSLPDLETLQPVPLEPETDLYGGLLFQRGRFQQLLGYRLLRATECVAEITGEGALAYFSQFLSGELVLGDPGARDAFLHAIQACVPDLTILPIGVDRFVPGARHRSPGPLRLHARERSFDGTTFVYDLAVYDSAGQLCERWEGLALRVVRDKAIRGPWVEPLLGPFLERRLTEVLGRPVGVAVEPDRGRARQLVSQQAMRRAAGLTRPLVRQATGKPELVGGPAVSAAHTGGLTLAVAGAEPLGCDMELVTDRAASTWQDLLGPERFALASEVVKAAREGEGVARTRVWTVAEALVKAGISPGAPLTLRSVGPEGWVHFAAGSQPVATYAAQVRDGSTLVITVLGGMAHASL